MKASVLYEYGGPENLKYQDFPNPIAGEGEVLVRVAATSVNPVDYKMRSGEAKARFPVQFPGILGRDIAGTVRELGAGVSGFEPGDRVLALGLHSYAELAVVKAMDLVQVPDGMDLVECAALPLVSLTGSQLVSRGTNIQSGQTILIAGAVGGVGRAAVMTAKKAGAIVIAGVRKRQLEEAATLGADEVVALDDSEATAKLGFVDAVADTVGHETAEKLLGKVKQGGIFASVLGPPANAKLHPTVNIQAVVCESDAPLLQALVQDILAKRYSIPIDRMVPLEDAGKAQAAAEKGGIGKVLILA